MLIGAVAGWLWHVCSCGQWMGSSGRSVDGNSGRIPVACLLMRAVTEKQ